MTKKKATYAIAFWQPKKKTNCSKAFKKKSYKNLEIKSSSKREELAFHSEKQFIKLSESH